MPTTVLALNGTCVLCFDQDSEVVDHAPELLQLEQNLYIDHNTVYRELMDMADEFDSTPGHWTKRQRALYANRHRELERIGESMRDIRSLRYPHDKDTAPMNGAYVQVVYKQP